MIPPQRAADRHRLQPGVIALPQSLLWLEGSRALIAADVHLAYEEAIGGALPLWSTAESLTLLTNAIAKTKADELILLGDIIHGTNISEGAKRSVTDALNALRGRCTLTLIAGNHEGRSRGANILGETLESAERDGWHLVHGDDPNGVAPKRIVGHLHPAIALGGDRSSPAFLACEALIVVPALTPYSRGLSVTSSNCTKALRAFVDRTDDITVVASTETQVLPFGSLKELREMVRGTARSRYDHPKLDSG